MANKVALHWTVKQEGQSRWRSRKSLWFRKAVANLYTGFILSAFSFSTGIFTASESILWSWLIVSIPEDAVCVDWSAWYSLDANLLHSSNLRFGGELQSDFCKWKWEKFQHLKIFYQTSTPMPEMSSHVVINKILNVCRDQRDCLVYKCGAGCLWLQGSALMKIKFLIW